MLGADFASRLAQLLGLTELVGTSRQSNDGNHGTCMVVGIDISRNIHAREHTVNIIIIKKGSRFELPNAG